MTEPLSYTDAIATLRKDLEANPDNHPEVPGDTLWLPITDISSMIAVFQPRTLAGNLALSEDHIETLAKAVTRTTTKNRKWTMLPPLTIWWSGSRWIVLDGHHRRMAYLKAAKELGITPRTMEVSARCFKGTLGEAVAEAARENSRDKLPMSREDKMNAAWRLVLTGELSKAEVAKAASVSPRQVAYMRTVVKTLLSTPTLIPDIEPSENSEDGDAEQGIKDTLAEAGWHKANTWSRGETLPADFDLVEARKRKAQQVAKMLTKRHRRQLIDNPEMGALALAYYDRRAPQAYILSEAWADDLNAAKAEAQDEDSDY